jgi:hypothetical protein
LDDSTNTFSSYDTDRPRQQQPAPPVALSAGFRNLQFQTQPRPRGDDVLGGGNFGRGRRHDEDGHDNDDMQEPLPSDFSDLFTSPLLHYGVDDGGEDSPVAGGGSSRRAG